MEKTAALIRSWLLWLALYTYVLYLQICKRLLTRTNENNDIIPMVIAEIDNKWVNVTAEFRKIYTGTLVLSEIHEQLCKKLDATPLTYIISIVEDNHFNLYHIDPVAKECLSCDGRQSIMFGLVDTAYLTSCYSYNLVDDNKGCKNE